MNIAAEIRQLASAESQRAGDSLAQWMAIAMRVEALELAVAPATPAPPASGPATPPAGPPVTPTPPAPVRDRSAVPDDGTGPTAMMRNAALAIQWRNKGVGDWLDHNGTPNGLKPSAAWQGFGQPAQWHDYSVTALVRKCMDSGGNQGWLLSAIGGALSFAGRADQQKLGPELLVTNNDAAQTKVVCPCTSNASWSETGGHPIDSRAEFKVGDGFRAVLRFDLSAVTSGARSATLRLYLMSRSAGKSPRLEMFELAQPQDAP